MLPGLSRRFDDAASGAAAHQRPVIAARWPCLVLVDQDRRRRREESLFELSLVTSTSAKVDVGVEPGLTRKARTIANGILICVSS